jgi:hypothetical protein
MDGLKRAIHTVFPAGRVLDVTKTLTVDTIKRYSSSVRKNPSMVLVSEETPSTTLMIDYGLTNVKRAPGQRFLVMFSRFTRITMEDEFEEGASLLPLRKFFEGGFHAECVVCYEETVGRMMNCCRQCGAEVCASCSDKMEKAPHRYNGMDCLAVFCPVCVTSTLIVYCPKKS